MLFGFVCWYFPIQIKDKYSIVLYLSISDVCTFQWSDIWPLPIAKNVSTLGSFKSKLSLSYLHPVYISAGGVYSMNCPKLGQLQSDQYSSRANGLFVFLSFCIFFFFSFWRLYTMNSANWKIIKSLSSANFYLFILFNVLILRQTGGWVNTDL